MAATTTCARHPAAPTNHALRPRLMRTAVHSAMITLMASAMLPAHAQQAQAQVAAASAPALGEIVVQAKRDEAASTRNGTTTVIKAEQLEQNNAIDMAKIARYSPLISVPAAASGGANVWDSGGNTGINIRGVEGNRVSLEVVGIAMPDAAPRPESTSMNAFGIGRDYFDPEMFHYCLLYTSPSPRDS